MESINQIPNLQPIQPQEPVKNSNIFKYLFIISIIVLLGTIVCFYLILNNKIAKLSEEKNTEVVNQTVIPTNIPDKTSLDINPIFDQIYQQIQKQTGIKKITQENQQKTLWITEDNQNIIVPSDLSLSILIPTIKNSQKIDIVNINIHRSISKIIESVLLNNNFTLNKINSSLNESDDRYYDYIQAYEKDNYKCVATSGIIDAFGDASNQGVNSIFKFSCFNDNQIKTAYDQQLPFLKLINGSGGIYDMQINGDEAILSTGGRRGGMGAYLYKSNNQWILISQGQDIPSCESLTAKAIPANHWPNCYYQNGTTKPGTFSVK